MNKIIGVIAAAAAIATCGAASATVYTTQAAFDAANPGLPSVNFDSYAASLASDGGFETVSNPFVVGGATFSTGSDPYDLYLTDASIFGGNYSTALSTEEFSEAVNIGFAPVSAIGVELASTYPGDGAQPVTFTLYNGATQLYSGVFSVNDMSSPGFVGFDGFGAITSVVVQAGDYPAFDTIVSVDGVSGGGVPEASTWVLMLAGFGGVGSMLRRAKTQLA